MNSLDLLAIQHVFVQAHLLDAEEFCKEAARRQVRLDLGHLEALYLKGWLTPLYQLIHGLETAVRVPRHPAVIAIPHPGRDGPSLEAARTTRQVIDPMRRRRVSWSTHYRRLQGRPTWTTTFLYSPYHLLALDTIDDMLPDFVHLSPRRKWGYRFEYRGLTRSNELVDRRLLYLLHALDPAYGPRIRGQLTVPGLGDFNQRHAEYRNFMSAFDPAAALATVGWAPDHILPAAEELIHQTWFFDPLEAWIDLVRLVGPKHWKDLEGTALRAMDVRRAAEILLYAHDDLASKGTIAPADPAPRMVRTALGQRLTTDGTELDSVLTKYGLSPHPSLLLVLEGSTEMTLIPRAMAHLGFAPGEHVIRLVEAGGVDRDVGFLASFGAVPGLGEELDPGAVLLTKPLTRILLVFDPEKRYATAAKRRKQKANCVRQIEARVPRVHRTDRLRRELNKLVTITTWGRYSFEFANFTNREIARAIEQAHHAATGNLVKVAIADVVRERQRTTRLPNVETLFPRPMRIGKVDVAEELWPILLDKLNKRIERKTVDRLPLGRVLVHAHKLAYAWPRESLVIRR
jgi:hypothetical protein